MALVVGVLAECLPVRLPLPSRDAGRGGRCNSSIWEEWAGRSLREHHGGAARNRVVISIIINIIIIVIIVIMVNVLPVV